MKPDQANHKITAPSNLLSPDGTLAHKGYSTEAVLTYNRDAIKTPAWKTKEWDFYQISDNNFCLQLTIGHLSYVGNVSLTFIDFNNKTYEKADKIIALPFNRMSMPLSAEAGDLHARYDFIDMEFQVRDGERRLRCTVQERKTHPAMEVDIILQQPDKTSAVMAIPFDENPRYFYYNHKINSMPASGTVKMGGSVYTFNPETAFGLLDWGRGVWPFKHEWFWGNGSTWVGGKRFGFNIGFGFGNTSAATENMLFYDGTAHKLSQVHVDLGKGGYMAPQRFTSDDGRFEMAFTPIYDHYTETKVLFINKHCQQVFGHFNGTVILDDGTALEIKDMLAFMEHAENQW